MAEGTVIRSIEIGIAASCGHAELLVAKRPRIAIFGTGDELVRVEARPQAHQIRQSNLHAIKGSLPRELADIQTEGHLSDTNEGRHGKLSGAIAHSDIVILSGAVSKGRLDWIPPALDRCGRKIFHGVSQRPGRPMGVWKAETGCVVFALPGNPVSTLVCTHRYILPFLRAIAGIPEKTESVTLAESFSFNKPLTLFLPVERIDARSVRPRPVNNSGDYAGLTGSDGFVELPLTSNHWTAGTEVPLFPWK